MDKILRKMFNRVICIFTFVTDIPILVFILLMIIIGIVGVIIRRNVTFKEYWSLTCENGLSTIKHLYANLWKSFRDGELYSVPKDSV